MPLSGGQPSIGTSAKEEADQKFRHQELTTKRKPNLFDMCAIGPWLGVAPGMRKPRSGPTELIQRSGSVGKEKSPRRILFELRSDNEPSLQRIVRFISWADRSEPPVPSTVCAPGASDSPERNPGW